MPIRFIGLLVAATFSVAAVQAQSICDGKYDAAQEMLDAAYGKYGTLYSGGDHWHKLDNVGATLDLYRLWHGLSDHAYRDVEQMYFSYPDMPVDPYEIQNSEASEKESAIRLVATAMTRRVSRQPSEKQRYIAAVYADLFTTEEPVIGWWLQDEPHPDLTVAQIIYRQKVAEKPALDWLQMTLAASYAPWAIAWHLAADGAAQEYADLYEHAADQFLQTDQIEWAVAAFLFMEPDSPHQTAFFELTEKWTTGVEDCSATGAEYAALAVGHLEFQRVETTGTPALVRGEIRKIIDYNIAARFVISQGQDRWYGAPTRPLELTASAEMQPVINAVQMYFLGSLDELVALHQNDALDIRTVRALNLLSADDIAEFARSRTAFPAEMTVGLQVAYLRYLALGLDQKAFGILDELYDLLPDEAAAIRVIAESSLALDVRLSLIALQLPYQSVWWVSSERSAFADIKIYWRGAAPYWATPTPSGMDLPYEFRTAQILQRDLEAWLLFPRRWGAYYGMRGLTLGSLDRYHARGLPLPELPALIRLNVLPDSPTDTKFKFNDLIAWTEIVHLGPKTGLSRRISEVLINWVDQGSNNRVKLWFAPSNDMADALVQVIHLNRHNDTTRDDGVHLGQRAFELLHLRFPQTDAAKTTPYWHLCSSNCEE